MDQNRTKLIIELRQRGLSYNQISKELNVHKSIISYVCTRRVPNNDSIVEKLTLIDKKHRQIFGTKRSPRIHYTDKELIKAVKTSLTLVEIKHKLRQKTSHRIKKDIIRLNINTTHLVGKAWRQLNWGTDDTCSIKMKLSKKYGHKCMSCSLTQWMGRGIPLQLHHKDGNHSNNDPKNLELICSNCHSQKHHYVENWEVYKRANPQSNK